MKLYYFNPKSQDLHIFDTDSKEMLVLERIMGIRVLTSSEIDRPKNNDTDPNFDHDPVSGKSKARAEKANKRKGVASTGVRLCKVCGKPGRSDYHENQGMHNQPAEKAVEEVAV